MKAYRNSDSYMTRRELLKHGLYVGLGAGLPASLWLSGCKKRQLYVKPNNIILISIDTLRADYLGCYGYRRPTSPTLDKLACQGLLFEDASTPSPWTLPAHASLLTGLYPSEHGVNSIRTTLPGHISPLALVLSQHGFATAAIVNCLFLARKFGFGRGFDHYSRLLGKQTRRGMARAITAQAMKWVLKRRRERFFLFLHYFDVHSDYRSLEHYEKQFVHPYRGVADGTIAQLMAVRKGAITLNQDDAKHLADLYAASIRQMDEELNRLFSFLEEQNLFDKTLLIVTSDHGEEFLEHGSVGHGHTQFQEVIHVPLIMHGPGLSKGRRIKEIASLIDVMPTTLGLVGIASPSQQDGIDLRPLWQRSDNQPPLRYIFGEASASDNLLDTNGEKYNIKRAIRHPRYKLCYDCLTKEAQLYDLSDDPQEKIDVGCKHTLLFDLLLSRLKEFMEIQKTGQQLPVLPLEEIEKLKSLGYLQ